METLTLALSHRERERLGGPKLKRRGINAIPQAGRRRAIVENMTQVTVATRTVHFGSGIQQFPIGFGSHNPLR